MVPTTNQVPTPEKPAFKIATPPELRLVAFNMSKSLGDVGRRIYVCPSLEDDFQLSYVHYPSKYIACYVQGGAKYVGELDACVRLGKTSQDTVLWKFCETPDDELIAKARALQKESSNVARPPCLVFLIGEMRLTEFVYESGSGLQSSRVFFDLSELAPTDLGDLAQKLRKTPWSTLTKLKIK